MLELKFLAILSFQGILLCLPSSFQCWIRFPFQWTSSGRKTTTNQNKPKKKKFNLKFSKQTIAKCWRTYQARSSWSFWRPSSCSQPSCSSSESDKSCDSPWSQSKKENFIDFWFHSKFETSGLNLKCTIDGTVVEALELNFFYVPDTRTPCMAARTLNERLSDDWRSSISFTTSRSCWPKTTNSSSSLARRFLLIITAWGLLMTSNCWRRKFQSPEANKLSARSF